MITDPTLLRIGQVVQLNFQGERGAARLQFAEIWDEIGGDQGNPLHVCTLAHAMADVRDDVRQELLWDLRALAAAVVGMLLAVMPVSAHHGINRACRP